MTYQLWAEVHRFPSKNADCTGCGGQREYRRGASPLPNPEVILKNFLKATTGHKTIVFTLFFPNHNSNVSQVFTISPLYQLLISPGPLIPCTRNCNSTCSIRPWCQLHWEFWAVWGRRAGSWRRRCWLRASQRVRTHRHRAGIVSRSAHSVPGLCHRSLCNMLSYFSE